MKRKVLVLASLLTIMGASSLRAQLNVGATTAPDASAALQISSTTKGLRLPQVSLTNTTTFAPVTTATSGTAAVGLMVYSISAPASTNTSYPAAGIGVYSWDGAGWISNIGTSGNNWTKSGGVLYNTAAANIGINTLTPYGMLANTSTNYGDVNGFGLNTTGFNWLANTTGYAAAINNTNNAASSNGLLIRVANIAAGTTALDVSQNTATTGVGNSLLRVLGSGNIGVGVSAPDASSLLELNSSTKGLRLPNVALTTTTTYGLTTATSAPAVIGMVVYNTATSITSSNQLYPAAGVGTYTWDGTGWIAASSSKTDMRLVGVRNHITSDAGVGSNGSGAGSGGDNIAIGAQSLNSIQNGTNNVSIGTFAMNVLTIGSDNVAIGQLALSTNVNGGSNIAIGKQALQSNTGANNIGIGVNALSQNIAYSNVAVGYSALGANIGGTYNIAYGTQALANNISSSQNTAMGYQSLYTSTGGSNTAFGCFAGNILTSGSNNTLIGSSTGNTISTGSYNIGLGNNAQMLLPAGNFQLNIGNCIFGTSLSGTVASPLGNIGINNSNPAYTFDVTGAIHATGSIVSGSTTLTSDVRLKKNIVPVNGALASIMKLKAVSYDKKETIASTKYNTKEMGFLAQDLRKVFPTLVVEGVDTDKTLSVNYTAIIPVLTKAIQEQQAEIAELRKQNAAITAQLNKVADLQTAMAELRNQLNKVVATKTASSNVASK